jgi:hypothetical protein
MLCTRWLLVGCILNKEVKYDFGIYEMLCASLLLVINRHAYLQLVE